MAQAETVVTDLRELQAASDADTMGARRALEKAADVVASGAGTAAGTAIAGLIQQGLQALAG